MKNGLVPKSTPHLRSALCAGNLVHGISNTATTGVNWTTKSRGTGRDPNCGRLRGSRLNIISRSGHLSFFGHFPPQPTDSGKNKLLGCNQSIELTLSVPKAYNLETPEETIL